MDKPTIDEVLKYATPIIRSAISRLAKDLPPEHKDEIFQDAMFRICAAYENLDPNLGWKSFVYNHANGAVLDYKKAGNGFAETRWSLMKPEDDDAKYRNKVSLRVSNTDENGADVFEQILSNSGFFSSISDLPSINWDLLAKLASIDGDLYAFCLFLRGFTPDEIASIFPSKTVGHEHVSRSVVVQMIDAFVSRFDDPRYNDCQWFSQVVYALGLSSRMGMRNIDNGRGHYLNPVPFDRLIKLYDPDALQQEEFSFE